MNIKISKIYAVLLLLTLATLIVFNLPINHFNIIVFVLVVFAIKFLLVAFYFMELKKAHLFWKVTLSTFLVFIVSLLIIFIA